MRRPPGWVLIGIIFTGLLPGCAGFQQREWFASEPSASARPTGLFSWWRGNQAPVDPAAIENERQIANREAPTYQDVWPEPPRSVGLFRLFPWNRDHRGSTSTHQLLAPLSPDESAQGMPPQNLSMKPGRGHGLPPQQGDVELDVNARTASANEDDTAVTRPAPSLGDAPLPNDLSASASEAQQPSPAPPSLLPDDEPIMPDVDITPRIASSDPVVSPTQGPGDGQTLARKSETGLPAPALLDDGELPLDATELQEPAPKPAVPPAPPITKPAIPPPPPITTPSTKPAPPANPPAPPAPPEMPPAPQTRPAPPATPAPAPAPTPKPAQPAPTPKPAQPAPTPKPAQPAPAPSQMKPATPAPAPSSPAAPATTPPPVPPAQPRKPATSASQPPVQPSLQETQYQYSSPPPMAAAEPRQKLFHWPLFRSKERVYASPQFPAAEFPATYGLKPRAKTLPEAVPAAQAQAPAEAPLEIQPTAQSSPQAQPSAQHEHHHQKSHTEHCNCHWHWRPGMYTMAFVHKVKEMGAGIGKMFSKKCCSCCTCERCTKAAQASPQTDATTPPAPAKSVSNSVAPGARPAPTRTASGIPGLRSSALNMAELFPNGDPVASSPAVRLVRAQAGDLTQERGLESASLDQELEPAPQR